MGVKGRVNVHIALPEEIVEHDREGEAEFVDAARELVNSYKENPLDWSKLLLESKRSTIDGLMGQMALSNPDSPSPNDEDPAKITLVAIRRGFIIATPTR